MQQKFIEKLIRRLIVKQDYVLLAEKDQEPSIRETVNVLIKLSGRFKTYIQVINGDVCPVEMIKSRLEHEDNVLQALREKGITSAYTIIAFEKSMDESKKQAVLAWQEAHMTEPQAYKCFMIDAMAGQAEKLFLRAAGDTALFKLIKEALTGADEAYDELPVAALAEKKRKDYEMTFAAGKPVITYGLIAVNLLIFAALTLYSMSSGQNYDELLIQFGAKVNSNIISGEYWRLITAIFLHGSLMHVLVNCYSLYALGTLVERIYGHGRFIISYMIAGIVGNIISFMFVSGYSVGASGAIFGLMGMLLYFGLEHPLQFKAYFGKGILATIVINFVYGASVTGIDNCAHLGGLIGGFLAIGVIAKPHKKAWYCSRVLYAVILCSVMAGGISYGFNNKQSKIIRAMDTMSTLEEEENWVETETAAKAALELGPNDKKDKLVILWTLVKAQLLQGKYDDAIAYCKELTAVSPENGHYLMGLIYFNTQQYSLAKAELELAKSSGNDSHQIDELLQELSVYDS